MTIVVRRRRNQSELDQAAEKITRAREAKLAKDAIKRYAKKNHLELIHHPRSWIIWWCGTKISMPAGYYARVSGVLENIIAK